MASNLIDYSKEILQANKRDLEEATKEGDMYMISEGYTHVGILGLKSSLLGRLGLSEKKLQTLSIGLQQIAERADVLGSLNAH
jgi:gamma-glutamyl phosphate reductase